MRRIGSLLAALCCLFLAPALARAQGAPPPPPDMAVSPDPVATPGPTVQAQPAPTAETVTAASHPSVTEIFALDFMRRGLIAGVAVGLVCAYLGIYVVLRRVVFLGMALAEFSSAGVAAALLKDGPPMLGSVLGMLAGAGLLSIHWAPRKVRQDTVIGIGYVAASAMAILILSTSPRGEAHLLNILSGNILTVTMDETIGTVIALLGVLVLHRMFAKELLFVSFDPDTAQASGFNVRLWDALLTLSIGAAIAVAVHAVGILLTFGELILPAVTALLATRRMTGAFLVAMAVGAAAVPLGLWLSFVKDLSPGATIVAVQLMILAVVGGLSQLRHS